MKTRRPLLLFPLIAFLAGGLPASLPAQLPTGAQVVHGDVTVSQTGNTMTLTQASRQAIVNWQSFNLGADAALRLRQSGADAAMLARVVGNDPSTLLGSFQADGKLFLINPKGIVVGQGAVIDTAAFLASTLDVSDDHFLRGGELAFKGDSAAGIVNLGKITAREGNVMLFAHTVKNAGEINAPRGAAALGAGTEVLLASPDASTFLIKTNLPATTEQIGVDNSGVIAAAQAQLEAAGGSLYELAINQSGVVRATGSATLNGRVLLTAADATVSVSGEISARNADGSGGEILVGGDYRGQNAAIANATRTVVSADSVLDAGSGGRAIVWADDTTTFLGHIVTGGDEAGFAEVSGKHSLDFRPAAPLDLGVGGTLLLDPDALHVGTTDPGDAESFLAAATLEAQLAASHVVLDTSTSTGDITFNSAIAWANSNSLTVRSGNNINLYADITGGVGSTLALYTGRTALAPSESGLPDIWGEGWLDSDATITVGTLIYGANGDSAPGPGYTLDTPLGAGTFFADGNLRVGTFVLDLNAGSAGISTNEDADNTIGAFRTEGDADFRAYVVNHHGDLDLTLHSTQVDGGYLQFFTPGNLTLKSGTDLTFTAPGNIILASTAGAFVNEAGPEAFRGSTRYLIYTSTRAATTKGGLTGTEVYNHPYDENDDYDGFGSTFFFSGASGSPLLTYTANDQIRRYGAANPAFTYTVDGWLDDVVNDVTGAPALSATATQNSGVGSYDITISAGTLASSNYDFSFVPGTLSITRAPLTITATDATRRIGVANPAFSASYAGFVLGETASALSGALTFITPATEASIAGAYTITPAGLTSANYNISFIPGTLTLTETTALLISANNTSRTYGAANPVFTASYSGFVGGEDESIVTGLQFNTAATQSSGVGLYTITPFGATATGYDINYASGTLEILRAPLTISVPNQSRLYGDANAFTVNYNGLVNGDTSAVVSGLSFATGATAASNVGNYAITASGASADNYSITYAQGSLTVAPAPLTVSIDPATRRYGDADPVFTYTVSGLKNGDASSLVSVNNLDSLATPTANAGSYTIVGFPFSSSPNYSVAAQVTGTLTVTPRPLAITVDDVMRYYGDPNPTFTAAFDGLASFDTPATLGALNFSTQATQSSGVGDWGITFATVNNLNYTITPQFGTLTIAPAVLLFDYLLDASRLYGRADPAMTMPAVSGLKNSDTVASLGLQFSGVPALTADAGDYTYTITSNNPNYTFTAPSAAFRIAPAPLTVVIGPAGRTYGEENPADYALSVLGLAFDDTAASVISVFNPTEALTDVGTYALTPLLLDHNYVITSATDGAIVISPRVLTYTAADLTKVYGDINPYLYGSITGFLSGDNELNVITNAGFVTTADETSGVGAYAIRPTAQTTTANYVVQTVDGTLTVTPAALTVAIADATRAYGQANPDFAAASAQGLKNDDTLDSLGLAFSTLATTTSDVGRYSIWGLNSSANYNVAFTGGILAITPASAVIAANRVSRVYGDSFTTNPFSLTFTGFLAADTALARDNWRIYFDDNAATAAGSHEIGISATDTLLTAALNKNYDITFQSGIMDITRASAVIAANRASRVYGDPFTSNPFTLAFTGFRAADEAFASENWRIDFTDNAATASGLYLIDITATDAALTAALASNYDITFRSGALEITRASATVVGNTVSRVRGDVFTTNPFTLAFTGFLAADAALADANWRIDFEDDVTAAVGRYAIDVSATNAALTDTLNHNYDITFQPGTLQVTKRILDPALVNSLNQNNTLHTEFTPTNESIEVDKNDQLTLSDELLHPTEINYYTEPLTKAEYASYFASFDAAAVIGALGNTYATLLKGKGHKDSSYEALSEAARQLLADFMAGDLAMADLSALIAAGDTDAASALGFILPSLVELTRDKNVAEMTALDRQILGRLADLTEKRQSEVVLAAQKLYDEMLATQKAKAEINGMANLFIGPGDFQNITQRATEEVIGTYIGATVAAAGTVAATSALLAVKAISVAIFPNVAPVAGFAAAGPGIAVVMAVALAVRSVQMGESIKNEQAFNELMAKWSVGTQITSIADLQSSAMDSDIKLSTLMLSAEFLSSK